MARVCRGGEIAVIGSPVRIGIGPSAIGGPMARIAEIVGRPSALAAAVSVEVRTRHRAATARSCTPPAGAARRHQKGSKGVVVDLAVGKGSDQGQLPMGRVRKTRSQRCNRTKPVRVNWSRNAARKLDPARNDSSLGPRCVVRTGVLAPMRSRGARPACALRRSTADGPARKHQRSGTWHVHAAAYCARSSREPSARAL